MKQLLFMKTCFSNTCLDAKCSVAQKVSIFVSFGFVLEIDYRSHRFTHQTLYLIRSSKPEENFSNVMPLYKDQNTHRLLS